MSKMSTGQSNVWVGGNGWWYDITHPAGVEAELADVIKEVLAEDTYGLASATEEGDVWVDAGCHVGLFSIAAMMCGADVCSMIDMDAEMAWSAEANARRYFYQQVVRSDMSRSRLSPIGFADEISSSCQLIEHAMLAKEHWSGIKRACLKLDIQGAEASVFADGFSDLSEAFDVMVMEWHRPEMMESMTHRMEHNGWSIDGISSHTDVLLNTNTHIVWAHSG